MRKVMIVLMVLSFSASALALEVKREEASELKFSYSGQALSYYNSMATINKNEYASYGGLRLRPYFSYGNDLAKAVVRLEIDQVWGKTGTFSGSSYVGLATIKGASGADVGNDETNALEVKAAFLELALPFEKNLKIKGGSDEYKTPGGFIIGTELAHFLLSYKYEKHDFKLLFGIAQQSNDASSDNGYTRASDKTYIYGGDFTFGFGDIKIRPAIYFIKVNLNSDKTLPTKGSTAFLPNLGISAKLDKLSIEFAAGYGTGKDKSNPANVVKYTGYFGDLAVNYAIQKDFKIGAFVTYMSGDDGLSTTEKKNFTNFSLKMDGWGRMYLMEDQLTFNNMGPDQFADIRSNSGSYKNNHGYLLAGLTAFAVLEAFEAKVNLGYGQLAKVPAGSKDLGFEADLTLGYNVTKGAKILAEFAYLATGKGYLENVVNSAGSAVKTKITSTQDAVYAGFGLQFKY